MAVNELEPGTGDFRILPRARRSGAGAILAALVALAVLAAAGVGAFVYLRKPSNPKREACVAATGKMLSGLKHPVELHVYVTRGTPKLDAYVAELTALIAAYERAAPGKLTYEIVEPKSDDEKAKAKAEGLQQVAMPGGPGEGTAGTRLGFMGISFRMGAEKEFIPLLMPGQPAGLEFWITNKLREVSARAEGRKYRIGFVSGKGEVGIGEANLVVQVPPRPGGGPSLKSIMEQAMPFYELEPVDLKGGDAEVPPGLAALLVTQPLIDFGPKELERIDAFLMQGNKGLAVFAGAANLIAGDATMRAELDTHGLEKLLGGYGIDVANDLVMDWGHPLDLRVMTAKPSVIRFPAILSVEGSGGAKDKASGTAAPGLDGTFIPFFHMEELAIPFASTLTLHPEKQPEATLRAVAHSSPQATAVVTGLRLWPPTQMRPEGVAAERVVAAALQGTLRSAFKAGVSGKDSRILVVASAELLANPFARAAGTNDDLALLSGPYAQRWLTATILAFKNTLDWMIQEDDVTACTVL